MLNGRSPTVAINYFIFNTLYFKKTFGLVFKLAGVLILVFLKIPVLLAVKGRDLGR